MAIKGIVLIIILAVIVIWLLAEFKRFRHRAWVVFLILLILFSYFGFMMSIKGKGLDLTTANGIQTGGKLYFAWLGTVFQNTKSITAHAVKLDWKGENATINSS